MPVISLIALNDALGGTLPARARLIATATKARTDGPTVTLPRRVIVDIVDSIPTVPIDLAATAIDWAWQLELVDLNTISTKVSRFVTVPDVVGPIDWGDLTDVDPETLEPDAVPEAAWWLAAIGSVALDGSNHLIVTTLGGTVFDAGLVPTAVGPQGNPGDSGVVTTNAGISGTLDLSAMGFGDIKRISLTGSVATVTLPTPGAAVGGTITVFVTQTAGGGWSITWPAGVKWADGIPAAIFTASGAISIVHLMWVGNGWYGLYAGGNFA